MAMFFAGNELAKHLDEKDKAAADRRTRERAAQGKGPKAADQRELGAVGGNPNAPAKPELARGPEVKAIGPQDTKTLQRVDHKDGSAKLLLGGDKQPTEIQPFATSAAAVAETNKLVRQFEGEGRKIEVDRSKIKGNPGKSCRAGASKTAAPKAAAGGK